MGADHRKIPDPIGGESRTNPFAKRDHDCSGDYNNDAVSPAMVIFIGISRGQPAKDEVEIRKIGEDCEESDQSPVPAENLTNLAPLEGKEADAGAGQAMGDGGGQN